VSRTGDAPAAAVRRFVDAFNTQDLDAFVDVLAPSVEIQGRRGLVCGHSEARDWVRRKPTGSLDQRLVVDGVRADGHPPVALIRRQWLWKEGDEVADEERLGVLVTVDDDGLISRWQPFDDPAEALRAAGLDG
jgi:hypothetical protein